MKLTKKISVVFFSGVTLFFCACGGTRGGEDDRISAVVQKINAKCAQGNENTKVDEGAFSLVLDGDRLIVCVQNKKDVSEKELKKTIDVIERSSSWIFLGIKQSANEGEESEIVTDEFFVKLKEKDIPIVYQMKDKDGNVLAETPLHLDLQALADAEAAQKRNREEVKMVEAGVQENDFTDPRDNRKYRTGTYFGETWFADNLIFGSSSEGLYTWDEAKNACPNGWRLPSVEELNGRSFREFRRDYMDLYQKPSFWSSTTKEDIFGNEIHVVVQHGLVKYEKEVEGSYSETIHEADAIIDVPMYKANSPEERRFVRCIKNK